MARLSDLLRSMSHYSLANLVIMAGGFISFPIFTRVLSVPEYGTMGLIVMLLSFLGAISKFGLQHASVRLWSEWEVQPEGVERFTFTFFIGAFLFSIPVIVLYDGVVLLLRPLIGRHLSFYILLSSPLLFIQALNSFGTNLLRARQRSRQRAVFDVATSYTAMAFAVLGATVLVRGLRGYYLGLMSGQALVSLVLTITVLRWTRLRARNFSPSLLREAIAYGLPLGVAELFSALFHMGDRLVIQWMLDETSVGYYTMAYNLAMYVNTLFTLPMQMAAVPMYSALYEKESPEATSEFLRKATRVFFMFAAPAVAGLWVVEEDIVSLLASRQFLPGAGLLHILLAGFLLYGSRLLLGAGMLLRKRVWLVAGLELAGAVANLLLNVVLIPRLGIHGSALATLVTQLLGAVVYLLLGARLLRVPIEGLALLRFVGCAAGMALFISLFRFGPLRVRLIIELVSGALVYAGLLLAVDGEARRLLRRLTLRRRSDTADIAEE